MGIDTGAIFNGFTFDGKNSKDYGVYITGSGVFNAPERDVEMISIPGRDGAFAQDRGRFSNIEVTYPAGLFGVDRADFAQAISDFRNMLASRKGYCRLEDDYNPGEYRMAVFKAGVDVSPASLESGEFSITFDCKPQRWLTSGETAVALSSGDDITNPTLLDARPVLQAWGYGSISVGGATITVSNVPIGRIGVMDYQSVSGISITSTFDNQYANSGDPLYGLGYFATVKGVVIPDTGTIVSVAPVGNHPSWTQECSTDGSSMSFRVSYTGLLLTYGTSLTESPLVRFTCTMADSTTKTVYVDPEYKYNGVNTVSMKQQPYLPTGWTGVNNVAILSRLTLDSSQSSLGSPMYIDLDVGEAYKIENDVPTSVNSSVTMPAQLPVLAPGTTTVTYDNTITQFKVVPRWWKV